MTSHRVGPERTVEGPELLHGPLLDRAPLRRHASLVLGARVPHDLVRKAEVLAHAGDCSHLQLRTVVATQAGRGKTSSIAH